MRFKFLAQCVRLAGLLVPVVSDAHDKTTRELAAVVARLIRDARAG